eukprot:m.87842 g.87842  ORF g.87842 m.87842 type:complete len:227 (+) comp8791_c6_seq1:1955-2635(+)
MSLNTDQVNQQIDHMIKFIESEAQEKADEIRAKTEEEFNIEKARLVQEEKVKITNQFERKKKLVETQRKIENSNKLNKARLEVLQAQDDHLKSVVEAAKAKSLEIAKDASKYPKLMQDLITQSLCSMLEENEVNLRCCKEDVSIVEKVLPQAKEEFTKLTNLVPNVVVDTETFLDDECGGGIVLIVDDRITVTNTLDKRIDLTVDRLMPAIRFNLFGASESRQFFE